MLAPASPGCARNFACMASAMQVYDERMLLHEEGKRHPHPERPDRLRAIMCRLRASGLAGVWCMPVVAGRRWHSVCVDAVGTSGRTCAPDRSTVLVDDHGAGTRRSAMKPRSVCFADHRAVARALAAAAKCRMLEPRFATQDELLAVHAREHVSNMAAACAGEEGHRLPSDTYSNQHTAMCASLAAGSAAQVAQAVARGQAPHGAAIIRPPGHHAESNTVMGFCFYNNAAVAARAAQAAGAERVAILDW